MRLGIAQMSSRAGDFDKTARRMVEQSRRAAEQGVDLLVFPMAVLAGVSPVAAADREGFLLDLAGCVMGLVEDLACPALVPVLTETDGTPLPEALLLADGDVTPVRLAARLEAAAAQAGSGGAANAAVAADAADALPEFAFRGARLGVAFTYEELDVYDDYDYDVDVIVFLSGYSFAVDDPSSALGTSLTEGRFLADAESTGAWVVGVGSLGCYDSQVFGGSSFVLAPWGELAAQAPTFEEALVVCDVDPSAEGPLAEPLTPEVFDAPLMTWSALTEGLSGTVEEFGSRGACAVADGGLASSLLLALAVDALGPTNVRALVCAPDAASDKAALALVRSLRLGAESVDRMEPASSDDPRAQRDLAEARLAQMARRTGCVPLGSLDKTARALEPAPLLSSARILPFGDLYRSDLIALARMRNTVSPVIPQGAIASAGAPDLGDALSDLPAGEARLEFCDVVLSGYVEWGMSVSDIVAERGHAEAVRAIVRRLRDLESLRPARPRLIAVSSRTLDEARGPAGLAWRDRARASEERLAGRIAQMAGAVASDLGADRDQGQELESVAYEPVERDHHDREVRDLLGYLKDFSAGGPFSPFDGPAGPGASGRHQGPGPMPPGLWDTPFSEN